MKQTAVEWLEQELDRQCMINVFAWEDEQYFRKLLNQAKQMEKEHIIEARNSYINQMLKVNDDLLIYGESKFNEITSEEYYNETYGNND